MTISHHPRDLTLADFVAGRLGEALATVVATHLELCSVCRKTARDFEAVGGLSLEAAEPAEMSAQALDAFWARAERDAPAPAARPPAKPLRALLENGIESARWRPMAPGAAHAVLKPGRGGGALHLLKFAPGMKIPTHTHRDVELTLVLDGAYEDEIGRYATGDLADLDSEITHAPRAIGATPCICLVAANAPLVFKGLIGRIMQPLVGL